jgi:uncharacterized protein YdhG (YjbR/CyaY superfamily)
MDRVESYIATFPKEVQEILQQVRHVILQNAPEAIESTAYKMPAYKYKGKPLVYLEGYKNHIGFYATPAGHTNFELALSKYKEGKGSLQFPLNEVNPGDLIAQIVLFKVAENKK